MNKIKLKFFKSKRNIIFLISSFILFILLAIVIYTNTRVQINIHESEYKKIGNNLYYLDELIVSKGRDYDSVLNNFQIISDFFAENYDTDIFISNLNYNNEDIYFNGYQLVNNVIVTNSFFTITFQNDHVSDIYFSYNHSFINNDSINVDALISVDKVQEMAYRITKENANKILHASNRRIINGQIHLEYDKNKSLYYIITLNNGSYIKIDAYMGDVIDTYFFDGIYF